MPLPIAKPGKILKIKQRNLDFSLWPMGRSTVAPANERTFVLPQLASVSAFFYYLGSITRYKPQKLEALLQEAYGAQLEEAVINLPNQFLFLMASEFSRQEVTRAAIV
jgi:hypothetical protein